MSGPFTEIAVGVSVHKTFHYRVPEELQDRLVPGSRVLVPFGSRRMLGTVIGFPDAVEVAGLKTIISVLDNALPPALITLAHWLSDYYLHPLGLTLETLVPRVLDRAKRKTKKVLELLDGDHDVHLLRGPKQTALLIHLCERLSLDIAELKGYASSTITALCDAGMARIVEKDSGGREAADEFLPSEAPELMP